MIKQAKVLKKLRSGLKEYKANLTGSKVKETADKVRYARNRKKTWAAFSQRDSKSMTEALQANDAAKALGEKAPYSDEHLKYLWQRKTRSRNALGVYEKGHAAAVDASNKAVKSRDKTRKMTGAAATVAGGLTLRALLRGYKASKSNRLIEKLKRNKGKAALGGFGTVGIADLALENRRKRKKLEASKSRNKNK